MNNLFSNKVYHFKDFTLCVGGYFQSGKLDHPLTERNNTTFLFSTFLGGEGSSISFDDSNTTTLTSNVLYDFQKYKKCKKVSVSAVGTGIWYVLNASDSSKEYDGEFSVLDKNTKLEIDATENTQFLWCVRGSLTSNDKIFNVSNLAKVSKGRKVSFDIIEDSTIIIITEK